MTEPLIVDPDRLARASSALGFAAADIPIVAPYVPAHGEDLLSMAIAKGALDIELPMQALPEIKRNATETAENVGAAGKMYTDTDREAAEKASRYQFANQGSPGFGAGGLPAAPVAGGVAAGGGAGAGIGSGVGAGAGSGLGSGAGVAGAAASAAGVPGAAGQAGGLSQMMGTPMQMAQQAGQIPQQLAQMAGSAPQGVMQGAQGAVQQVTQMAGQFGKSSGEDGKAPDLPLERAAEREDRPEDRPAETVG